MVASVRIATLAITASCLAAAYARAQPVPPAGRGGAAPRRAARPAVLGTTCQVEGVWDLVATSVNGAAAAPRRGYHERKLVTRGHFMWLGEQLQRDTLPLRTQLDSLRALSISGGSGTYTTSGNTYTERLDYFYDPRLVGQTVRAVCRVEGDLWYHSFRALDHATASPTNPVILEQTWRRVR